MVDLVSALLVTSMSDETAGCGARSGP